MEGCLPGLIPLLVLGGLAGGWIFMQRREYWRDEHLEKVARRLSMDYCRGLPEGLRDMIRLSRPVLAVQEKGGELSVGLNSISGTRRGRTVVFFDGECTRVFYAQNRRECHKVIRFSVVAAGVDFESQPVVIRPERLVDKVAALAGYDDIDFDGLPEFSRKFYVNGPDRAFARRLVTPELARFLLGNVRCAVDFCGPWLMLYTGARIPVSRVTSLIELAGRLAELASRNAGRFS